MGRFIDEFNDWLNQSIVHKPYVSRNITDEKTYGASSNIECYIEGGQRQIINFENNEVISTERLYFDGSDSTVSSITIDDFISLDSRERPIQRITKYYNENGDLDFLVVYL